MAGMRTILAICPAQGAWAVFEDKKELFKEPVIVWAAYRDTEEDMTGVAGMTGTDYLEFADEAANFKEYWYEAGSWLPFKEPA